MYDVTLQYENENFPIHNNSIKLLSGSVKQGINCIDSFSFDILPNNIGFNKLREFKTIVRVYNSKTNKYEFQGRVLQSKPSMSENGLISKNVVCESFLGYLQDTEQDYVKEQNWTPTELLTQLLTVHNRLLANEPEKHFKVGVVFTDENIYIGIQRESTWQCINEKIIGKVGGEIQLRVEKDGMYIDILKERGTTKATSIALSKNMKSITKESDPSSFITRLIPLGAKIVKETTITDEEGNTTVETEETEERVDITSVNGGLNYIDDAVAVEQFGIITKHQYWDDVNNPQILKTKATNFIIENNKVLQKYSITTLDLALLGIDIDTIEICNYYPVKNKLIGIDDVLRVITKEIDVVNETSTNIEIGDSFKTLIDLEIEKTHQIDQTINTVEIIEKNYVTNQVVESVSREMQSLINQTSNQIQSVVAERYTSKSALEEYQSQISTMFTQQSDSFQMTFTEIVQSITNLDGTVNSNYNELVKYIRFVGGTITLGEVDNPLILTLSNDRMSFIQNGTEVAYISDKRLYIYDGEFINSLKIGRWVFIPRKNGNLSFKRL